MMPFKAALFGNRAALAPAVGGATAPVWLANGAAAHGTTTTTPGLPAGYTASTLLLMFTDSDTIVPAGLTTPAEWTFVTKQPPAPGGTAGPYLHVYRAWGSDVTGAPSFTVAASDHVHAVIVGYDGVNATTPLDVAVNGGISSAATAMTANGVTTVTDKCRIVTPIVTDADALGAFASLEANANLTGLTERYDDRFNDAAGGGIVVYDGVKDVAGATGDTTATQVSSSAYRWVTLALRPA